MLSAVYEPGSNAEIKEFAAGYNVKFDMYSKICVNGDDAHPLWKWMKVQPKGRGMLGKCVALGGWSWARAASEGLGGLWRSHLCSLRSLQRDQVELHEGKGLGLGVGRGLFSWPQEAQPCPAQYQWHLGTFLCLPQFLIDKNGCVVKRYGPMEEPLVIEKDLPCYL
ncbi:Phospholipid hydroperoxide glutathione peroxidase, mitochondrial [Tupaia chinensis]|uniref:phospholipid-hydroperoxide glutathione peroxidase n=1 Tax=Tupaia chinensis TaxID=246437 RepID=L8XZJ3_TUPCH|nr:Phospholipid hydroperoxide glutathione peroxidase, mitochondrial [Tupaia chinensis]